MRVAPDSIIHILKDIPLSLEYRDTIYFENKSSQEAYFYSKKKYTFMNYSYLRKEEVIRVEMIADNLLDCNYIMFKNSAFGNKWFYAFITNVEYVNNTTANISYEVDVMQTWAFDYQLQRCFVEREHTTTDIIGDNLLEDNLELGEYKYELLERDKQLDSYNKIIIASTFDKQMDDAQGKMYGGIYTGLEYNVYKYELLERDKQLDSYNKIIIASTFDKQMDDAQGKMYGGIYTGLEYNVCNIAEDATALIDKALSNNKQDGIVNIFMMPESFTEQTGGSPKKYTIVYNKYHDAHSGTIDGYLPKNKKMFTYPYCFMYVTNNNGTSANYPFEYFGEATCKFDVVGLLSSVPQLLVIPLSYKGVSSNFNERIMLKDFPQCSYNIDSFKAYLAQNASQLGVATAIGLVSAGISYAGAKTTGGTVKNISQSTAVGKPIPYMGVELGTQENQQGGFSGSLGGLSATAMMLATVKNISQSTAVGKPIPYMGVELGTQENQQGGFSGSLGGLSATAMMLARLADKATLPPQARGGESGAINTALFKNMFDFYYCFIRQEYAIIIDNFWSMYGYPCRRVKVPNINVRPHWTYTKTIDSCITGSIPAGDLLQIKSIFNNGITFWKHANEIGNYSLDNSPT